MRKRSSTVALTILGAASFALAGCKEEQVDAQAFPDLASCQAAATDGGLFTADQCQQAFADAETLHVEAAPRYESLAVCEEQHGEGNCGSEAEQVQNGGSGSIFMPLLAGYLIGSMLGRAGGGMAASQPMYRNASGGFTNAEINELNTITADFSAAVVDRGTTDGGFSAWGGGVTFDNDGSTNWHYDHVTAPSSGEVYVSGRVSPLIELGA
ncbi:MAG: hypothetical protein COB97_10960, partial [Paracoccus sp.]